MIKRQSVALISAICLLSCARTKVQATTNKGQMDMRAHVVQGMETISKTPDGKVHFVARQLFSSDQAPKDRLNEFDLAIGQSFYQQDDHGRITYTLKAIQATEIILDYVSQFDLRSFGKNEIDEDRGEIVVPLKTSSKSESPWLVTIQPLNRDYSIKDHLNQNGWLSDYKIPVAITNVGATPESFGYWSCAYFENWKTNSSSVQIPQWNCKSNLIHEVALKPGESFRGEVPVSFVGNNIGQEVRFRLGFVPSKITGKGKAHSPTVDQSWSNEIAVKVVE